VTREVRDLDKDASSIIESFGGSFDPDTNQAAACAVLVDHLSMRRNKRCLLAYHRTRVEKLEEMVWSGLDNPSGISSNAAGNGVSGGGANASGASSLSPQEEEYFRQYGDIMAAYKGIWLDIDLVGSLEPPKDLFVDVRVLKDLGEVQTEYGYVNRAITFLPWTQMEILDADLHKLSARSTSQRIANSSYAKET
jgi:GINS complex subunit 1